jgi:hypothetical protein
MFCLSRFVAFLLPDFLYTMPQNHANRTVSLVLINVAMTTQPPSHLAFAFSLAAMLPSYWHCSPNNLPVHVGSIQGHSFLHSPPPSHPAEICQNSPVLPSVECAVVILPGNLGGPVPSACCAIQTKTVSPKESPNHPATWNSRRQCSPGELSLLSTCGSPQLATLPMPRPSLEPPKLTGPLEFDDVVSKLKPLLEGMGGSREIMIDGVTPDVVEMLQEKSRALELPGFKNLRYDLINGDSALLKHLAALQHQFLGRQIDCAVPDVWAQDHVYPLHYSQCERSWWVPPVYS